MENAKRFLVTLDQKFLQKAEKVTGTVVYQPFRYIVKNPSAS